MEISAIKPIYEKLRNLCEKLHKNTVSFKKIPRWYHFKFYFSDKKFDYLLLRDKDNKVINKS